MNNMNDQELDNILQSLTTSSTGTDTITLGSSGPYISSIGTDTITLGNGGQYITNGNWNWEDLTINKTPLKVTGDAEIDGQLKVGGKNIGELLDKIEQRLAILTPNPELEAKWEELKELGDRYRELEKDILEKEAIYRTLSR